MEYVVSAEVRVKLAKLLRELETRAQEIALSVVDSAPVEGLRERYDRLVEDIARLRRVYKEAR
jgi:hypothetical protein